MAATKGDMTRHVIDPGEALTNESEDATWTSHGSKGPPRIPNQAMHWERIKGLTGQPPGESTAEMAALEVRPTLGSAELT